MLESKLTASILSPDGNIKPIFIERSTTGQNQYRIDFIPEIKGLHKISVFDVNKKEIKGIFINK